jgi:hypothetical protein
MISKNIESSPAFVRKLCKQTMQLYRNEWHLRKYFKNDYKDRSYLCQTERSENNIEKAVA